MIASWSLHLVSHPGAPFQFLRLSASRLARGAFNFLRRHSMHHVGMSPLPATPAFDLESAGSHGVPIKT